MTLSTVAPTSAGNDRGVSGVAQLAFLRAQGLLPLHHVLEIGCGPCSADSRIARA